MDIKKCILFVFLILAIHFVKSEDEDIEIFEQCQGRAQRKIGWPVINQKRKTIKKSMKKNHKVTCPELNNVTFTDKKPFNILGVPKCLKHKLVMELFINDYLQRVCNLDFNYLPNWQTERCFNIMQKQGKDVNKMVIIIHGFMASLKASWVHEMKNTIQDMEENTAVMILGWGKNQTLFNYDEIAADTRYVAEALFQVLYYMKQIMPRKIFVHCIGHSLGAQICGFTGKLIRKKLRKEKEGGHTQTFDSVLDRISGLDPAGPMFFNDNPEYKYPDKIEPGGRLTHTDAQVVDIIHTDGILRSPFQYGTLERAGTVDFYIGANGSYGGLQPGCNCNFCNLCGCSHHKAHMYYIASMLDKKCQASRICHGDPKNYPKSCTKIKNHTKVKMGYFWKQAKKGTRESYTVEVRKTAPYCTKIKP